jgi:myo-inositol-1(or 4)-monophosphatase
MKHLLVEAKRIVRNAGLMAKEIPPSSRIPRTKIQGSPVTEGDIRVEEYVICELKKQFPDHGIDSEEMGKRNPDAECVWILDPIDGTDYYVRDVPLYSVSLALERNKKLVLGVVYMPELDRIYYATAGQGATMNNRKIRFSDEAHLSKASIFLEIPSGTSSSAEQQCSLEKMSALIQKVYRVRIIGVGSLGLCFCATGGFDAYVNLGTMWKRHDIAAGQIIVREAGGEFSYLGERGRQIVAGPAALCSQIRALIGL